jgi:hypothetical protein
MKTFFRLLAISSFFWSFSAYPQVKFDQFFMDKTLRLDFLLAGNYSETHVYPVQMKQEPYWAGSKVNLVDQLNHGNYRFKVLDHSSGALIFSRGFSTLFQEWQTTSEAKKMERSYYQAIFFPFPQHKVIVKIENRDRQGVFQPLFETIVDPDDYFILRENPYPSVKTMIAENGEPGEKVDIVFLAEGYISADQEKFNSDVKRLSDYLFESEPFSENKNKFNIVALWTPSLESGMDVPGESVYKDTRFNSAFYTFNISRYLTTSDMKSVYDAAACVPWDFAVVLVNTERYGGGGIYNFVTVCSSDNESSGKVFAHELGHGLAGLADEYYNSEVAYEDFYNKGVEPWEPNITTLVDFPSKWKKFVADSIPVPTPRTPAYKKVTGVFEGGGYMEKGIFSPMQDCRMKSNRTERFCPVCSDAIQKVIDGYSR